MSRPQRIIVSTVGTKYDLGYWKKLFVMKNGYDSIKKGIFTTSYYASVCFKSNFYMLIFKWSVIKISVQKMFFFMHFSYIFPYTFSDNCRNHANFGGIYLNNEKRFSNSVKSSWKCITYYFRNIKNLIFVRDPPLSP